MAKAVGIGKDMMRCCYCGYSVSRGSMTSHEKKCILNPQNLRKFMIWLKDRMLTLSTFEDGVMIFPTITEFNLWAVDNKIHAVTQIRRAFGDVLNTFEEIFLEIVDIGIRQNVTTEEEFPVFIKYIFDSYCGLPFNEFKQRMMEVYDYEKQAFTEYAVQLRWYHYGAIPRSERGRQRIEGPYGTPRDAGVGPNLVRYEVGGKRKQVDPTLVEHNE